MSERDLSANNVHQLFPRLEAAVKLFTSAQELAGFQAALSALTAGAASIRPVHVSILLERDIHEALATTRNMCRSAGARPLSVQAAATAVSELSRNIVSYTPGGRIDLMIEQGSRARLKIRATDRGKGIGNLTEVLSGNYKSKTGLGKGLLGIKRLSSHFHVSTGATGTTIDVEIEL